VAQPAPRHLWLVTPLALLVFDGVINGPIRHSTDPGVLDLVSLVAATLFFWWTLHYLLAVASRGPAPPSVLGAAWQAHAEHDQSASHSAR
jgi:hypothetical protein